MILLYFLLYYGNEKKIFKFGFSCNSFVIDENCKVWLRLELREFWVKKLKIIMWFMIIMG